MSPEDFDAYFGRFTRTAFRLETRQDYCEPERVEAFLLGLPRPERSVRTSPWLARIAVTTVGGKRWQRVRVVKEPLTAYTRYEMAGYAESQAAGEEIRIARLAASKALDTLRHDFWLFDAGTPAAFALLLDYDLEGRFTGAQFHDDAATLARCEARREIALHYSVALNEYLAGKATRAA